ncbi:MAG: hypothetical protein EVA70_00075 [Parvularculaceae bacterium]|nr:MAG: hypothetical protein EVA70_00075 [Parvularculaceae bacterium]
MVKKIAERPSNAGAEKRGRLKRAVAGVAPQIAHALGGPLAGAAVGALSRAIFGIDDADEAMLADVLEGANPKEREALMRAEHEFRLALRQANLIEQEIAAGDRANARDRQVKMDDLTPSILGGLIIGGFFVVLAAMVTRRLPAGAETEFSIMLGALATMTAAVVNYFFGSSVGSREKTRMMSPVSMPDSAARLEPVEDV